MPRDMANAALFVASDESAFMNGAVIVIDSGKEVLSDRGRDKFYHCGVAARVLSWQHPHGQRTGSHFARPLESGRS